MSVKKLTAQRLRQIVMEEAAAMRAPRKSTKLTESRLRQIIREELNQINESLPGTHAIWSEPARRAGASARAPYYEFYFTGAGDIALRDADRNDKGDELGKFCKNHACEKYEVGDALQLALGLETPEKVAVDMDATPEQALERADQVLSDLKVAYPGAEVNGQQISKLSIS